MTEELKPTDGTNNHVSASTLFVISTKVATKSPNTGVAKYKNKQDIRI